MIYIQVKRKNEKLMAEQIEWVLTLIYFEKNSQRCKNKKYEKYKYCSDLIVVWVPQVSRNWFRRFVKLIFSMRNSQTGCFLKLNVKIHFMG